MTTRHWVLEQDRQRAVWTAAVSSTDGFCKPAASLTTQAQLDESGRYYDVLAVVDSRFNTVNRMNERSAAAAAAELD
jgi:hypothetical protein